jgi:hypothetical protein
VYSSHQSGDFFPVGTTTVTYTVVDQAGNQGSCSFTVTVNDTEAPVITCPANIVVSQDPALCPNVCGAVVNFADATATDNCPGVGVAQIGGLASGSTFPLGATTITYKATDAAGNMSICTFTVTVTPLAPTATIANADPTDVCEDDPTVALSGNTPGACFSGQWTASGPGSVSFAPNASSPNATATFSGVGSYTVTWTVTASCTGATASDAITVNVNALPLIDSISANDPLMVGASDGDATAHVSGGHAPYNYLWSDGQTTQTAIGLSAGTYCVTVTDAKGCSATGCVTLLDPPLTRICKMVDYMRRGGWAADFRFAAGSLTPTSGRFSWDADSAMVFEYASGEINIVGRLRDTVYRDPQGNMSGGSFLVNIWIKNRKVWTSWNAAGGTWEGNPAIVGNRYQSWEYYVLDATRSTMIGQGRFAGDTLFLTHNPALTGSNDKAWQYGEAANRNDADWGISGGFAYTSASGNFAGTGMMSGDLDGCRFAPFAVQVRPIVMLEGAYDNASNSMTDNLRAGNLIPGTEPYTGLGYNHVGGGGETVPASVLATTGSDAIVDWVIVELRDKTNPTVIVATRAALMQRDGDVVDTDGVSDVTFNNAVPDLYYVVVRHRNHLGVMTGATLDLFNNQTLTVDFTNPSTPTYGNSSQKLIVNGRSLLYGGDADFNGQVQNTDDVYQWIPQTGTAGYQTGDYNLDGQVQNTDRQYIWFGNSGRGDEIPD